MTRHFAVLALASLATTGFAAAAELVPASGHSIRLGRFTGVLYYAVEPDGYRAVATLASGAEDPPIRFVSTLAPGQRMLISVPQGFGEPSIDFEVVREGAALIVNEPAVAPASDHANGAAETGRAPR